MGNDDTRLRPGDAHVRKLSGDEFIRETVKAVTPHTVFKIAARKRKDIVHKGMLAVKGRVEAGNLRGSREGCAGTLNTREVMRLMERRQRFERFQLFKDDVIDQNRGGEIDAAMDDAVTHGFDRDLRIGLF